MTSSRGTATPSSDAATKAGDHRLPYGATPRRYELWFAPDLAAARFAGTASIELEVHEHTDRIVMNAAELDLRDAVLVPGWRGEPDPGAPGERVRGPAGEPGPGAPGEQVQGPAGQACTIELDPAAERVSFVVPALLAPGRYRLSVGFDGVLNDRLCGFYRSVFTGEDGTEQVIATTQFQETDARRAFPCLDEPDRKAVFSITLDEPPGMLAVSNGAEISATPLPSGGRRVRFSDTIPMSTYLVAFVVGPLEASAPVDAGGVPLRVVHTPGKGHLVGPAIEAAAHALSFFRDYFDLPYPGDKVDLVALPDFAAGAMENLGCVTFREAILLADPERAGRRELERLAEVVEHELAHMWFGDLVTMRWWNGVWLNEAFATFMALRCLDDYRPQWEVFVGFARQRAAALSVDGLHSTRAIEYEVHHPDEVGAMFDVLTYQKGAAVLWMIEQYLGEERFRNGVRCYLAAHRLDNAETHDLWDALEAESGEAIAAVMDSWIFQGGHPLVTVGGHGAIELSQEPFSYLSREEAQDLALVEATAIGSHWLVPVLVAPAGHDSGETARLLLDGVGQPVQRALPARPLVVNAGGSGFYRIGYDATLRAELLERVEELAPLERYGLVSDTWAGVLAGREQLARFKDLVDRLGSERDPDIWASIVAACSTLDVVAPPTARPGLARYVGSVLRPLYEELGFEQGGEEGERRPLLRAAVIGALGGLAGNRDVIARAVGLAEVDLAGGTPLPSDLAAPILAILAAHATHEQLIALLGRYRAPRDPMDGVRNLYALAHLRDEALAEEVLGLALIKVRSQNAPYLLAGMLANRYVAELTWSFVRSHFEEIR
ncbi:MAG TPA: M1 family metallopeptidase, partial [Acidimicrobiales bacterium]|nr:M1 family metallopeptidase [Acidimicrobiales bacterium]